jgi:hypothetical protein
MAAISYGRRAAYSALSSTMNCRNSGGRLGGGSAVVRKLAIP